MISGLQKMTLLDYPGKVACTVFLQGCNFRCPFCHNSELLPRQGEPLMELAEFLAFLEKRKGLLDAVCISGGEPTLQPQLPELMKRIKDMGFAVKLDTNGSHPDILKDLLAKGLVDYVAMDVKNSPAKYPQTLGVQQVDMAAIEESLRTLISGDVSYELRTTLVAQFHDDTSIREMGQWLGSLVPDQKPAALYLQTFVDRDTVAFSGLCAPAENDVVRYRDILTPYIRKVTIRN